MGATEDRRAFLRAALAGTLATLSTPELAASSGRDTASVRTTGAQGDGIHDDTRAFQRAIDQVAGKGGGVVTVPAGRYLIDPVRSVRLRSKVALRMATGAQLLAKPNAASRAYVLLAERVADAEISGGETLGERDAHLGKGGEWGHGVMIRGSSRVTVRGTIISRCWGDGISIGASTHGGTVSSSDILIENVVCRGNRRQGLTIGRSRRVRVVGSEFSDTHGTKPEYGIDIEPDRPGRTEDVTIERCTLRGNRGGGIQVYLRVSGVVIRECTIEDNGHGIYTVAASNGAILDNTIRNNRRAGVALRGRTSGYRVEGNRFAGNNTLLRISPPVARSQRGHVQLSQDSPGNRVGVNRYE